MKYFYMLQDLDFGPFFTIAKSDTDALRQIRRLANFRRPSRIYTLCDGEEKPVWEIEHGFYNILENNIHQGNSYV